MNQSLPCLY